MFVGHTRFSLFVPQSSSWRASNGSTLESDEDYKRFLYEDSRLALRSQIFLEHTVPTLAQAAAGHEVAHIVSYSASLPQKYKDKLRDAAESHSFLYLDELPDGDNGWHSANRYVQKSGFRGVFGRYRLDDDDLLSTDYFRLTQQYIRDSFVGMVVSLPLGIEAIVDKGQFYNLREAHVPMNSMGLLSICRAEDSGSITGPQGGPHDKSDRYDPVILDARGYGYLRCLHAGQDNAMRYQGGTVMQNLLAGMGCFPSMTSFEKIEHSFPTVSKSLLANRDQRATVLTIDQNLSADLCFWLKEPASGVSVVLKGLASRLADSDLLISYVVQDSRGKRVPNFRVVDGLITSANSEIGHFGYIATLEGKFQSIASTWVEGGASVVAFCLKQTNKSIEPIHIDEVTVQSTSSLVERRDPTQYEEAVKSLLVSRVDQAVDVLYNNRTQIVGRVRELFGARFVEDILPKLGRWRKRLRQ